MPRQNSFKFEARHVLLTYPGIDNDLPYTKEALLDFLKNFNYGKPLKKVLVSRENHECGTKYHFHAVLEWKSKFSTRQERLLDWNGMHPNWSGGEKKHDTEKALAYAIKDGNFIGQQHLLGKWVDYVPPVKFSYLEICQMAENSQHAMELFQKYHARDFVLQNDKIKAYCYEYFTARYEEYVPAYPRESFTELPEMTTWFDENIRYVALTLANASLRAGELFLSLGSLRARLTLIYRMILDINSFFFFVRQKPRRPRTLILVGPSRTGKTEWARSLGNHVFMSNMWNVDDFRSDASYIVFDDIPFQQLVNSYKSWFGGQQQFTVTDKYRKKVTIRWGKPCIYLCNEPELEKAKLLWDRDWIDANVVYVKVMDKLY